VHVIREDPYNRDLLFVGTDVGAYVSTNRGASWQKFMNGLPTVPVHDLKIHPRDRELIAATHGRSIYVLDIAPLEQMADSVMSQRTYFFQPTTAYAYSVRTTQEWNGNKIYVADNPPYGATLNYRVATATPNDSARVVITDVKGDVVRRLTGTAMAGMNRITWDLRGIPRPLGPAGIRDSVNAARARQQREDSTRAGRDTAGAGRNLRGMDTTQAGGRRRPPGAGRAEEGAINLRPAEAPPGQTAGGGGGGGGGRFGRQGAIVEEGDYLVTITVGGTTLKRVLRVERIGEIPPDQGFGGDEEEEEHEP
jgi:hypothetical protein